MRIIILISADAEWDATLEVLRPATRARTPYGECFTETYGDEPIVFLHGGWGKVAAAAAAEYAIGRWNPEVILNLGTCGGIEGRITTGDKILATKTIIYDIREAMGDPTEAIDRYSTTIDLDWLGPSMPVSLTMATLYSADCDLVPAGVEELMFRHGAIAADWESGAIAYVANRRQRRPLIIRQVSDLVSPVHGEVVGDLALFRSRATAAMRSLLDDVRVLVPFLMARLELPSSTR